uniref:Uncharacterized protein n=1 Tax=Cacopsylla melanoneura TaxID=428564 RepID=A0A8D8Y0E4_9HEMI
MIRARVLPSPDTLLPPVSQGSCISAMSMSQAWKSLQKAADAALQCWRLICITLSIGIGSPVTRDPDGDQFEPKTNFVALVSDHLQALVIKGNDKSRSLGVILNTDDSNIISVQFWVLIPQSG